MLTQFATLTPDAEVGAAADMVLRTHQSEFPVVDGNSRPLGVLARADLIRTLKEHGPNARVADAMSQGVPTIGSRHCLDEAFRLLQETSAPAVGVVDASGALVGLVTPATIGDMLMRHHAPPTGPRIGPWQSSGRAA
jgi:CBS domain-containing protein